MDKENPHKYYNIINNMAIYFLRPFSLIFLNDIDPNKLGRNVSARNVSARNVSARNVFRGEKSRRETSIGAKRPAFSESDYLQP